ncbi:MAG: efflux RND transporter permease subunit, partial [Methylococcales bacterium]|nr:efflux RND transporter permease subunit [Methylococcales bacterium]
DADSATLQGIGQHVREALLALPEVSKLKLWGQKKPEIRIEIAPWQLEQYQLSIGDIQQKIQQASFTLKGGQLKSEQGNISLSVDSQAYYRPDFENIVILDRPHNNPLLLKDIALIEDDFENNEGIVRFNGHSALGMEVLIGRTENLLDISRAVKDRVSALQTTLPDTIKLSVWADSSGYISERLKLLQGNALQGLLLVFVLLALFLNLRLAFWVAMGIPVSVAGALAVMGSSWMDYSLNDITTFGLILALGILVDDAVVVGESVFEARARNPDPLSGTEKGVRRVSVATIYGVLTSIAALFPMLLIDNALGKVLASFAAVVILTLSFSLIESKFILPAHLARIPIKVNPPRALIFRPWFALQSFAQRGLERFNQKLYRPVLKWSLAQRYAVLIVFVACAALGVGLIIQGKIKTQFFPDVPGQMIRVNLEMDARAPLNLTLKNASRIENR